MGMTEALDEFDAINHYIVTQLKNGHIVPITLESKNEQNNRIDRNEKWHGLHQRELHRKRCERSEICDRD